MKWNIITDSSCDMFGFDKEHENIVFSSVPFTISVGDENFVDDRNLDVDGMIDSMDACAEASHTACPSPHAWQEKFEQEGNVIAITISSKLSGSYNRRHTLLFPPIMTEILQECPDRSFHPHKHTTPNPPAYNLPPGKPFSPDILLPGGLPACFCPLPASLL